MTRELYETGLQIRREVLGAEYVNKSISMSDDFNRPLQEIGDGVLLGSGLVEART